MEGAQVDPYARARAIQLWRTGPSEKYKADGNCQDGIRVNEKIIFDTDLMRHFELNGRPRSNGKIL